ncbi:MAG TPA: DNA methyltransferase [Puia sp.]|nr:DNA methyltransferase [Puia sp.]
MTTQDLIQLHNKFDVQINQEWSFNDSRSTESFTHNYHRYPAKFIPQVVKKLIEKYTVEGDTIADVFAGCGTTLVESKLHGRACIGVDINPVARLITDAKINPLKPELIQEEYGKLESYMARYHGNKTYYKAQHPRINYWFRRWEKNKIAFLYHRILKIEDTKIKTFYLCALSNVLKNCSRWLQDSTKPQIDPNKKIAEPFSSFSMQVKKMITKNKLFYEELKRNGNLDVNCRINLADARNTRITSESISAVITSPPYVTSYEYADIHQLTGYWYEYISDLPTFRKAFIGTFYSNSQSNLSVASPTAQAIVESLQNSDKKVAKEVVNYFNDMNDVAREMKRILSPKGVICMVMGNTTLRNVKIKSAEAFAEILSSHEFLIEEVIRRPIPNKHIPPTRDIITGKFTAPDCENSKKVYPDEFIIVARKPII